MSQEVNINRSEIEHLQRIFPDVSVELIMEVQHHFNYDMHKTAMYLFDTMTNDNIEMCYQPEQNHDESRIIEFIRAGWKVLILMRGLPGSGKSTLARKIFNASNINYSPEEFILSTDDFFMKNGKYNYNPKKLEEAHEWNQKRCYKTMIKGYSPIIIDNTNLVSWEMKVYCFMAMEYGYVIEILEPTTEWAFNPHLLASKNIHNIGKDRLIQMLNKYKRGITPTSLLAEFRIRPMQSLPQKRLFPPLFDTLSQNYDLSNNPGNRGEFSNSALSNQYDLLFNKKELPPVKEYVHSFHKKPVENEANDGIKNQEVTKPTTSASLNETQSKAPNLLQIEQDNLQVSLKNQGDLKILQNDAKNLEVDTKIRECLKSHVDSKNIEDLKREGESKNLEGKSKNLEGESKNLEGKSKNLEGESKNLEGDSKSVHDLKKQNNLKTHEINKNVDSKNETTPKSVAKNIEESVKSQSDGLKCIESDETQPKVAKMSPPLGDLIDLLDDSPSQSGNSCMAFPLMPIQSRSDQSQPNKIDEKNHLTSWGTNVKVLQSWDTVVTLPTAIKSPIAIDFEISQKLHDASNRVKTQVSDKTTNTTSTDFRHAQSSLEANGVSILNTKSRAINGSGITITKHTPRKKITVDMGCMTDDLDNVESNEVERRLSELFPGIPIEYMLDVYEKCNKDLNWATELLLDTPYDPKLKSEKKLDDKKEPPTINTWETASTSKHVNQLKQNDLLSEQKKQEKLELKKQFEDNITFKKEHYSDYIWGLKTQRQNPKSTQNLTEETQEFDDVEVNEDEGEETIQIDLGYELIGQLEKMYGEEFINPKHATTVQMPVSLAKQLHALYLQSVCQQIEELNESINKDEEYAHRLNNEEREALNGPNLSTIMDEQLAMFCQQKENEQFKTMAPETLAMLMKKNKLYDTFPTVNRNKIDQLLEKNDNNYEKVVEILMEVVDQKFIVTSGNIQENPIVDEIVKDMVESKAIADAVMEEDDHSAKDYREEAAVYAEKAVRSQNLASQYHQKGMGQIAVFYSKIAEDLRKKRDISNHKAAFMYLYENHLKGNNDTIDLHYLNVPEAITSLDIFIDKCVAKLDKPKDYYVITGRGKHSAGGKSKLRPAIMSRLNKRKIKCTLINPGLLKISLHKNVTMTNDLKK